MIRALAAEIEGKNASCYIVRVTETIRSEKGRWRIDVEHINTKLGQHNFSRARYTNVPTMLEALGIGIGIVS